MRAANRNLSEVPRSVASGNAGRQELLELVRTGGITADMALRRSASAERNKKAAMAVGALVGSVAGIAISFFVLKGE